MRGPGGIGRSGPARPGGFQRPGGIAGTHAGRGPVGRGGEGGLARGLSGQGRPPGIGPASGWQRGGPARIPGAERIGSDKGLGGLSSLARSSNAFPPKDFSTFPVNRQELGNIGNSIRDAFNQHNNYNFFAGDWWNRYGSSWYASAWAGAAYAAYGYTDWANAYRYCGYGYSEPAYYDYGSNVVYEGDTVYVNGSSAGTQALASKDDDWLSLGVFAMTQGEQSTCNDVFQLAVNKSGVVRGNYYNALGNITLTVSGSVDQRTQRAAWTIGDRKEPVFEAGFANLTKSETTMLVHFGNERTQQWNLVRLEQPGGQK
jgi:hypothetical protein